MLGSTNNTISRASSLRCSRQKSSFFCRRFHRRYRQLVTPNALAADSTEDSTPSSWADAAGEGTLGESSEEDRALQRLLTLCASTNRGADAGPTRRGEVEETCVELERLAAAKDAVGEYLPDVLDGLWRLQYTTAADVTSILDLKTNQVARVGGIFQKFSRDDDGTLVVENITEFGPREVPPTEVETPLGTIPIPTFWDPNILLGEVDDAVTFTVRATYDVASGRRIRLKFQEARVSDVSISSLAEAVVAPALLPRGQLQMEILQSIRDLDISVPLSTSTSCTSAGGDRSFWSPLPSNNAESSPGASYVITPVCGGSAFVGRAVGTSGRFVFTKE